MKLREFDMKYLLIKGLIITAILCVTNYAFAIDPPHSTTQSVYCNSCHSIHKASGTGLTSNASNANLCLSCHVSGGTASTKRFDATMQATPGSKGTSHRWDAAMPATSDPNNQYGLKAAADLTNSALKSKLGTYGNIVTCSVCHNQHAQATTPWDPNAPASGSGRHFQSTGNDLSQMCEDCHAYRKPATTGTDVRTYDGNKKSHPVMKIFSSAGGETPDVTNPNQFNAAPYEPLWNNTQQTGSRYHQNGGSDTDTTNNIVVDSSKQIRCLSCHGAHYTDSDSATTDGNP